MPIYEYKAMTEDKKMVSSKINIDGNEIAARERLEQMGLKPISIKKKAFDAGTVVDKLKFIKPKNKQAAIGLDNATTAAEKEMEKQKAEIEAKAHKQKKSAKELLKGDISFNLDLSAFMPVKVEEVVSFTEMFMLLKRANFTNIRAMTTMYNNTNNGAMKAILGDIVAGLETGTYINTTMSYYPKVFPEIYVNLVRVGEETGSLVNALEQALIYLESSTGIKKKVKKALLGPILQAVGFIGGGVAAIYFGLPMMQDMYASYGLDDQIPEATMAAANVVYWCSDHWALIIAVIVAAIFGFNFWRRTPAGKYAFDKFKINAPIFGPLILRLQVQKFFIAVNINLKNNARLQDAISDCKKVVTNDVMLAAVEAAEANMIVGNSWIEPFENMPKFPPMVKEMLRIGMETNMSEMIENILKFIDEDIDITIRRITAVLPQVSMGFMGIILVGFVIIILKPIMEVYMGSFLFEANGM